jgi:hypothetical protein
MSSRLHTCVIWAAAMLAPAASTLAQEADDSPDARLVGYTPNVALEGGSTATTWLLLVGLAIVCIAPMFMNARRTHLD